MKLLTAQELAGELAVSPDSVWAHARAGRLPCVRLGRSVRFPPDVVERLIEMAYNANHAKVSAVAEDQAPAERDNRSNVVGGVVRERRRRKARASEREPRTMRAAVAEICEGLIVREGEIIGFYNPLDPLTFRNGILVASTGGKVEPALPRGGASDD